MTHPFDYYGRIRELEHKLKVVELENERLKKTIERTCTAVTALGPQGALEDAMSVVWDQMRREARQTNRCMACDALLRNRPSARRRVICADRDCLRFYQEMYYFMVAKPRRARGTRRG